jgi:hypothetical protein
MALPWLFHITDPEVSKLLGPLLHEAGGIVVADPAYLTEGQRTALLHTVGAPDDGELPITIHAVDWTTTVAWEPDEPEAVARDVYTMADSPAQFYDSPDSLPEDTPEHVIAWLDLDDEDEN